MIKHIVMLKLKACKNAEDKLLVLEKVQSALKKLPNKIPEIQFYEIGANISKSKNAFDIVLLSDFNNLEELDKYRKHPEHVKVLGIIKETTENIAVTDYELYADI